VIVYRVEHAGYREGPYNPEWAPEVHKGGDSMSWAHTGRTNTPGPRRDMGEADFFRLSSRHFFGFKTREALDRWFCGWKRVLHAAGYLIAAYEVPEEHVIFGKRQLAFVRHKAQHITDLPVINTRGVAA
jgi:hypothetical protein